MTLQLQTSSLKDLRDTSSVAKTLTNLEASLATLIGASGDDFLHCGDVLGKAVTTFGTLATSLEQLSVHLHSDDVECAIQALRAALHSVHQMSSVDDSSSGLLAELDGRTAKCVHRLAVLSGIVGEILTLGINGKIQVALVSSGSIDFSVFTTEISRLGQLAKDYNDQALSRLTNVHDDLSSAKKVYDDFTTHEAKELETVQGRIDASVSILAERQRKAAASSDSIAVKLTQVAARVTSVIGELQVNDSVSQRIDHVRTAIGLVRSLIDDSAAAQFQLDWTEANRHAMIAALSRLQVAQLNGAAHDYSTEVDRLKTNLMSLARDASDILAQALDVFGGSSGGMFVTEIEQEVARASTLLSSYDKARTHTCQVIGSISDTFRTMSDDLEAIKSIDKDMRIMGLNATLKCGRLGDNGRALGVVAHELRACSRRTEDCAIDISQNLESMLTMAAQLSASTQNAGGETGEHPLATIETSLASLTPLGARVSEALADLRANTEALAATLEKTATGIEVHRRVSAAANDAMTVLGKIATGFGGAQEPDQAIHAEILRLMMPHYTMNRERTIHQQFSGGTVVIPMTPENVPASAADIDDLFF